MKIKIVLSIFTLVVLMFSIVSCQTSTTPSKLPEIMGVQTYETIRSADGVIFCIVNMRGGIEGSEEFTHCINVPSSLSKEITAMMTNDQNYLFGVAKTNLFFPQSALIFKHRDHQVSLQINETSSQFRITVDGKDKILDYSPMKSQFNQKIQTLKK